MQRHGPKAWGIHPEADGHSGNPQRLGVGLTSSHRRVFSAEGDTLALGWGAPLPGRSRPEGMI